MTFILNPYRFAVITSYDADAQRYFDVAKPSQGEMTILDAFYRGLKADDVFSRLQVALPLFSEKAAAALIDLKTAVASARAMNSPTHLANRGFRFDGGSNYVDSGYVPSNFPNWMNTTEASTHMSVWALTPGTINGGVYCGMFNQTIRRLQLRRAADGQPWRGSMSANNEVVGTTLSQNVSDLLAGSRLQGGSTIYRAGVSEGVGTQNPNTPNVNSVFIGARSNAGTPTDYQNFEAAFFSAGEMLSDAHVLALRNRVRTVLQAKGNNV